MVAEAAVAAAGAAVDNSLLYYDSNETTCFILSIIVTMMHRYVPPKSKQDEVENKQFKQTNEPLERLYFYVPHDGTPLIPLVADIVFHFVSPKDRHFSNGTLILRSLVAMNTLLREPRTAHVATPELVYRWFKYMGVCHTEREHFRRTEKRIRRINITFAGCMRLLDVFAELHTLLDVTGVGPQPPEDCSFQYLYLWLRPCGFDAEGRIVLRDTVSNDAVNTAETGSLVEDTKHNNHTSDDYGYDFTTPDVVYHTDAFDDPFDNEHRDVGDGLGKAEREKKRKEEEEAKKKQEAERFVNEQPDVFWQWVPFAFPFPLARLYGVQWPRVDPKTGGAVPVTHDEKTQPDYPFRKYPNLLYIGRAMTGVRGDAKYATGDVWRNLVFGPPVQTNKSAWEGMIVTQNFEKIMRDVRPLCRVIHVDATMAH